jgi:hypothetical protein
VIVSRWLVTEAVAAQHVNQGGQSVVRQVKELAQPFELWRVDLLLMPLDTSVIPTGALR